MQPAEVSITRLMALPSDRLAALVAASDRDGEKLLRRLVDDWISGANAFNQPGELCLIASIAGTTVGICGLNIDPYLFDPKVGRVRHLYVMSEHRCRGIGGRLVKEVIAASRERFMRLRLRTFSPTAARFYVGLGFVETSEPEATHVMEFP